MEKTYLYHFFEAKSNRWIYFFLGFLAAIIVVVYLFFPSAYNQGIYHYQGLVIKNGGLPYNDFIEKKGPMGLLTYSLASLIFGETAMAYRLFDLLILGLTGILLFSCVKHTYSPLAGWFASVLWFSQVLVDGPGNTADVTNIITACCVALSYVLLVGKKSSYAFIVGLLSALACWVKPTAFLIVAPLIALLFTTRFKKSQENNSFVISRLLLGAIIPTAIFIAYLLISGTFRGFWEAVVLDPLLNYADNVSRFSYRVGYRIGYTFIQDPIVRIGGFVCLFFLPSNQITSIARVLVIGGGLMLFVEGRWYTYHFSILWPFLALGFVHGIYILSQKWQLMHSRIIAVALCIVLSLPTLATTTKFVNAGGLGSRYNAGKMFLLPAFREMYDYRQEVSLYLKSKLKADEEIFVLGLDPNIYLELGAITTCRLAREGILLVEDLENHSPNYLINWRKEILQYMQNQKADWIIVFKEYDKKWNKEYFNKLRNIFSIQYELTHETTGHLIYRKSDNGE